MMEKQVYLDHLTDLHKVCEAPIAHSAILTYIDILRDFNVEDYLSRLLKENHKDKLPSSLRSYIVAI